MLQQFRVLLTNGIYQLFYSIMCELVLPSVFNVLNSRNNGFWADLWWIIPIIPILICSNVYLADQELMLHSSFPHLQTSVQLMDKLTTAVTTSGASPKPGSSGYFLQQQWVSSQTAAVVAGPASTLNSSTQQSYLTQVYLSFVLFISLFLEKQI